MNKHKWAVFAMLVLLLLWPVATAQAAEPVVQFDDGQIFVGEDVSLKAGETFEGDLGVLNGDLTLPEGSAVNGDVFVTNGEAFVGGHVNGSLAVVDGSLELASTGQVRGDLFAMGGTHQVSGHVRGNVAVLFGDMELRSTALVEGDLLVTPGGVEREEGAQVRGNEVHDLRVPYIPFLGALQRSPEVTPAEPTVPEVPSLPSLPSVPSVPSVPRPDRFGDRVGRFVGRLFATALMSLTFLAVGALAALVWPRRTRLVADCIARAPWQSFGLGLLTYLLAVVLEALAAVLLIVIVLAGALLMGTVVLIPIGLLLILLSVLVLLPVPLALAGGTVLGWVGLAELLGGRILRALKVQNVQPLGAVMAGLFVTVLVAAVLWIAKPACCGWPFVILLTSLGLGAVFHTRFGTQGCRQPASPPSVEPEATQPGPLAAEAMDMKAGQPDIPKA